MSNNLLLKTFCNYIERTWITSSVWPPNQWLMFMQHRRTNNNAEGYHNSLKLEVATNSPNLIKFIRLLKMEADKIDLKSKLLSQKQALQQLSKDTNTWQHHLTEAWDNYNARRLSPKELLEKLAKLSRKHSKQDWRDLELSEVEAEVESD